MSNKYQRIIVSSGLCFISGSILYKMTFDLYQKWRHDKNYKDIKDMKLKDFFYFNNLGGYSGLIIGSLYGYYNKPLIEVLASWYSNKTIVQ